MGAQDKKIQYLVADTTAFLQNAALQDVAETVITCQEVVDEIVNKRQLRRLVVLPYDLKVKDVFPENIKIVTDFAKKTGDYPSLSATDIKVIALTYQLEKEHVGIEHICTEPTIQKAVILGAQKPEITADVTGFFAPGQKCKEALNGNENSHNDEETSSKNTDVERLKEKFKTLQCDVEANESEEILTPVQDSNSSSEEVSDEDDDSGWITPSNVHQAKKQVNSELMEEKDVKVACMTTDFAMQNVLKQMKLNVVALDGRVIKQLRTFIFRCYACFKTTSIMTKKFCPKCGLATLKKVAVSLDENGQMQIHINTRRPLTARGKKFSLPRMKGGKHPNNPILAEDHPMPQNRVSKLARQKINPLDDDYIAGFSPFAVRDVTSRSAQLGIRGEEVKYWMRKNPNEVRKKRK